MKKALLYLHIPKAGGTTLSECIYREMHSEQKYQRYVRSFVSGIYYYPIGFAEQRSKLHPSKHCISEALADPDLNAVVGHFSFGLHRGIPKPSIYVSVIREPVDRVLSLFHHLKWVDELPYETSVEEFMGEIGLPECSNDQVYRISGISRESDNPDRALVLAINNLEKYFPVVGVTDLFDESLVLMKRKLGWQKDLAYYPRNVNPERLEEGMKNTAYERGLIASANQQDISLYNFVKSKFIRQIKAEGSGFARDIANLRKTKAVWAK